MMCATRKGEGRAREEARDAPKRRDTGGEGWRGGPLWVSCVPPGRIKSRGRGRPQGSPPHLRSSRVPTPPFPPFGRHISVGTRGSVGRMRGPCACPPASAIHRMRRDTSGQTNGTVWKSNGIVFQPGQAQGPRIHPTSAPCPYRTQGRKCPCSSRIQSENIVRTRANASSYSPFSPAKHHHGAGAAIFIILTTPTYTTNPPGKQPTTSVTAPTMKSAPR